MRRVRVSKTFERQLADLLDAGEQRFGQVVIEAKRRLVERTIRNFLPTFPGAKTVDPKSDMTRYPITGTPFVVIYDFDDDELRVHFIYHYHSDFDDLDKASVDW